ncbi:hypothetical protein IFM89_031172 [Coptis chinensis]|uniref:glycerophosphodiester phosphodiesterase n=1 Tax=Coptis chinensis TaxID=261450 RepID=A0A835IRQ8_9MAGN|nr:hypothetical protein IFM89_031172 [Coptis chinensis]
MALKAVHVSDVPNLHLPKNTTSALYTDHVSKGVDAFRVSVQSPQKFMVIGHRGSGMNMLQSADRRMKAIKENTILSFNSAANFPVDFVEFDVQVTRDDCPVIFHDNFIYREENGIVVEKRVTELTLAEFLCYGGGESSNAGESLLRKTKDGRIFNWKVESDDCSCTLKEAFKNVDSSLGFNIELKFDDYIVYQEKELINILGVILQVVFEYAKGRPVIFSSFQPDATRLIRKLQNTYPVFFLTNGGSEIHIDVRRNSLDEAIQLCMENGLQGIVSEVKAVFRQPGAITRIKESSLSLFTYGQLNNVPEAVHMQHLMGIDGVIVDLVREITEAVYDFVNKTIEGGEEKNINEGEVQMLRTERPNFSQHELSFLLKLIPQLIQL